MTSNPFVGIAGNINRRVIKTTITEGIEKATAAFTLTRRFLQ